MGELAFNLKFVAEVEKFPELYNFKIKSYNRRDATERAWNEVGKTVQLSASECKEKWKNLRSVFVRHLKAAASGSDATKKKPYYLWDSMQFALPFIRKIAIPEGYVPEEVNGPSTPIVSKQIPDTFLTDEEEQDTTMAADVNISVGKDDPPQSFPARSPINRKRNTLTDVDKAFKDYLEKEKLLLNLKTRKEKKIFLLSLLPEIEPLTDVQMRSFRRGVLRLIDEIRGDEVPVLGQQTRMSSQYLPYPTFSQSSLHGNAASLHQESDVSIVNAEGLSTSEPYFKVEELDSSKF